MFILSSISSGLIFCSLNHNLIYENYELKVTCETSSNLPNDLLVTNVYNTLESG